MKAPRNQGKLLKLVKESARLPLFVCTRSDFHPYECNGPKKCIHCDRKKLKGHDPKKCALCNDGL